MNCGEQGREKSQRWQINGENGGTTLGENVQYIKEQKGQIWKSNQLDGEHVEYDSNVERQ